MEDRLSGHRLPEHPELREIAEAIEGAGISGEILDARWRLVFISSEQARMVGLEPDEVGRFYGMSMLVRQAQQPAPYSITDESGVRWWRRNVPIMRRDLDPADEDFETVFGELAEAAAEVEPAAQAPRAWHEKVEMPTDDAVRRAILGDLTFFDLRLNGDDGELLGVLRLNRVSLPESLLTRLGRGDRRLFERMDRVSEPARRPAGILYADLESSGELSRRLSSSGYFELISALTDLIDTEVIDRGGIVGKHAGDGASALFLVADLAGSESAAARAAIAAARAIRDGSERLGPDDVDVRVNIGVHWGATPMVGQVATRGRLEVTALGDQMNEGARIEAAARNGQLLASKDLIERLNAEDGAAIGLDPGAVSYTPLADLDGVSDKAIRDAGAIAVAEL